MNTVARQFVNVCTVARWVGVCIVARRFVGVCSVCTLPQLIVHPSLILSSFDTTVCTVVFAGLHSTRLRPELGWSLDTAVCTAVSSFRLLL